MRRRRKIFLSGSGLGVVLGAGAQTGPLRAAPAPSRRGCRDSKWPHSARLLRNDHRLAHVVVPRQTGSLAGNGKVVLNNSGGTTLTIGNAGSATFAGAISDLGGGANNGSLTATGSGTVVLSGTSTYGGSTTVKGGTLDITGALSNSAVITVNAATTPATLILDGAGAVTSTAAITGTAGTSVPTVTINANQSFASLTNAGTSNFNAGSTTIGTIANTGTTNVASAATLNATSAFSEGLVNNAGTININGGSSNVIGQGNGVGGGTATTGGVIGAGTFSVNGTANLTASVIRQAQLNIASGSTVTIADSSAPGNNASVSVLTDLNNSGTLDLKNNDMIINDSAQNSTIVSEIASGYNSGSWNGSGITSSSAKAQPSNTYGLGYATGAELGTTTFEGQAITSGSTVVKYTLLGDTTLKGSVGIGDYNTVVHNFLTAQDWSGGNFHYGVGSPDVGIGDYNAVVHNFLLPASGNLASSDLAKPSLALATQSSGGSGSTLTAAWASLSPALASSGLSLEVNTATGDVYAYAAAAVAFTGYGISDPSGNLVDGGQNEILFSMQSKYGGQPNTPAGYRSSTNYKYWSLVANKPTALGEGENNAYYVAGNSSTYDTVNIPAGGTIDFGQIYGGNPDLTFQYSVADANTGDPTTGNSYYNVEVDYIGTPEPASLGILGLGGVMMMRRRRSQRRSALAN
jgi:autotransporter-associated beta strand protein